MVSVSLNDSKVKTTKTDTIVWHISCILLYFFLMIILIFHSIQYINMYKDITNKCLLNKFKIKLKLINHFDKILPNYI